MFEVLVKVDTKTNEPIIIILLLVEQVADWQVILTKYT